MKLYLNILFFLFSAAVLFAGPSCDLKYYTGADGFRNSSAIDILQAKNGLIWISTRNGLTLFDGYSFRNYKSYPEQFMNTICLPASASALTRAR
jgi:ligand-binding sensor domain-containing protein